MNGTSQVLGRTLGRTECSGRSGSLMGRSLPRKIDSHERCFRRSFGRRARRRPGPPHGRRRQGAAAAARQADGAHVLERLAPQVDEILINANQNLDALRGVRPPRGARRDRRLRRPARRLARGPRRPPTHARGDRAVRFAVPAGRSRRAPAAAPRAQRTSSRSREDRRPAAPGVLRWCAATCSAPRCVPRSAAGARSTPGTRRSRSSKCAFDDEADAFRNINTRGRSCRRKPRWRQFDALRQSEDACASCLRRRLRPELDAGRQGARGDPRVPRADHGNGDASRFGRRSAACSPQDIVSPIDVPAHDNSAMDGYARALRRPEADGETALTRGRRLVRRQALRRATSAPAQCVRIMTGAVMPDGADTVVMQERAKRDGKSGHRCRRRQKTAQNGASPART